MPVHKYPMPAGFNDKARTQRKRLQDQREDLTRDRSIVTVESTRALAAALAMTAAILEQRLAPLVDAPLTAREKLGPSFDGKSDEVVCREVRSLVVGQAQHVIDYISAFGRGEPLPPVPVKDGGQ